MLFLKAAVKGNTSAAESSHPCQGNTESRSEPEGSWDPLEMGNQQGKGIVVSPWLNPAATCTKTHCNTTGLLVRNF